MNENTDKQLQVLNCPVCGEALDSKPIRRCQACDTPVHEECGDFIGGCPRFACEEAATPRKRLIQYLLWRLRLRAVSSMVASFCMLLVVIVVWKEGIAFNLDRFLKLLPAMVVSLMLFRDGMWPVLTSRRLRHTGLNSEQLIDLLDQYSPSHRKGSLPARGCGVLLLLFGAWVGLIPLIVLMTDQGPVEISTLPLLILMLVVFFICPGLLIAYPELLVGSRRRMIALEGLWRDEFEQMRTRGQVNGDTMMSMTVGKLIPGKGKEKPPEM